jgi:hypothetical protein
MIRFIRQLALGIVDFDHIEAVNALAKGQVAMITEWSAFYSTLVDPKSSKIVGDLAEVGTNMMIGNNSVKQGSEEIGKRVEDVLSKAGYYGGEKKLAQ